ncbi:MAG: hypothetical protein FWE52_01600 [Alphaproteobacteria bacterium]|nr:hypothetical protein [Alphaproteobacteria bacterium]
MRKIFFTMVFLLFAVGAQANDFFAPRKVTLVPSADECVGDTSDMLCVFDTVIACAVRADAKLCEKVGLKYDSFFKNSMVDLTGKDYEFRPVELFLNQRRPACAVDDNRACITNPATGRVVAANASIKDNNNVGVFLRNEPSGKWSVIFATQFACWPDEDCS